LSDRTRVEHVFNYSPDRVSYSVVVELRSSVPGSLKDVLERLAQNKLNLLAVSASDQLDSDKAVASLFVEPTGKQLTADEVKAIVNSSPFVLSCIVEGSQKGILVAGDAFPIRLGTGQRAMILRTELFSEMLKSMREQFASGGDVIVYHEGIVAGENDAVTLTRIMGNSTIIDNASLLVRLYTALGWGRSELTAFEPNPFRATIRVEASFECESQRSNKPYSQFLRGHFAGFSSRTLGTEVVCEETRCVTVGDPYCEFLLRAKRGPGPSMAASGRRV
jgi:predicted hydrocarbon binding protein